jgi:hypothetical protein
MHTEFSLGSLKEKRPLRKPGCKWVVNIKTVLRKSDRKTWIGIV